MGVTAGASAGSQRERLILQQGTLRPVGGPPCLSLCCDRRGIQTWSSQDPESSVLRISLSFCRRSLETEVFLSKLQ